MFSSDGGDASSSSSSSSSTTTTDRGAAADMLSKAVAAGRILIPPMQHERQYMAVVAKAGEVFAIGSICGTGEGTVERYNVVSRKWVVLQGSLPRTKLWGLAAAVLGDAVVITGGCYVNKYHNEEGAGEAMAVSRREQQQDRRGGGGYEGGGGPGSVSVWQDEWDMIGDDEEMMAAVTEVENGNESSGEHEGGAHLLESPLWTFDEDHGAGGIVGGVAGGIVGGVVGVAGGVGAVSASVGVSETSGLAPTRSDCPSWFVSASAYFLEDAIFSSSSSSSAAAASDPPTSRWVEMRGALRTPRRAHASAVIRIDRGRILGGGGGGGEGKSMDVIGGRTRREHGNGREYLVVAGGIDASGRRLSSVELYRPDSGSSSSGSSGSSGSVQGGWYYLPDMCVARDNFHLVVVGGELYAVGGGTAAEKASIEKLEYVVGGGNASSGDSKNDDDNNIGGEDHDGGGGGVGGILGGVVRWRVVTHFPANRAGCCCVVVDNDDNGDDDDDESGGASIMLLGGGGEGDEAVSTTWDAYDVSAGRWASSDAHLTSPDSRRISRAGEGGIRHGRAVVMPGAVVAPRRRRRRKTSMMKKTKKIKQKKTETTKVGDR